MLRAPGERRFRRRSIPVFRFPCSRDRTCRPSNSPSGRSRESAADQGCRGIAHDGDELPFPVHLAILFKVYRMTLRFHSVLSLSPVALANTSARKSSPAGVADGLGSSISARKQENVCKQLKTVALSSRG